VVDLKGNANLSKLEVELAPELAYGGIQICLHPFALGRTDLPTPAILQRREHDQDCKQDRYDNR
jgi:hypothetical protein